MCQPLQYRLLPSSLVLALLNIFVLIGTGCQSPAKEATFLGVEEQAVDSTTRGLLQTWYPRIVDTVNGGYWTNFEYDWTRSEEQPKMLVTQARGLWTAARAAIAFPDAPVYSNAADHGYRFLTEAMWDEKNGGFYQYYRDRNAPASEITHKMSYGNAFALYALSEYAKINEDPGVRAWVEKAFQWLEEAAHDDAGLGYRNIILPDSIGAASDTAAQQYIASLGWGRLQWKDQNSSIHLLEALSNARRVLPDDPLVEERLAEMLHLVRDTMVDEDGYLHLYFHENWEPVSHRDSTREYILDNLNYDHVSFGHDIETAYLLLDAAESLHGQADPTTIRVADKLVKHSMDHGFDDNYYGLYDRGYYFTEEDSISIVNTRKTWWSQAEAWHTLALYAMRYPDNPEYEEAFRQMWRYLQQEMIDHQHGGWYNDGPDENPESKTRRKAHPWKGAYHNGRALMQVRMYAAERRSGK